MKQVQQGFTLIELMIVVAIIGILAAIAIPAYQDYTIRAKMSEALNMASSAKTSVSEYIISQNAYPADATEAGFESNPDTDVVNSVTWDQSNNAIIVTVKAIGGTVSDGDGFALEVSSTANSRVVWRCNVTNSGISNAVERKYLPANCR